MATQTSNVGPNDLNESLQDVTLKATIPFAVLAVLSILCRFLSRTLQKSKIEFDDYMSVIGLILTLGCFTLSMMLVHYGSGKHLAAVPVSNIPKYFKVWLLTFETFLVSTRRNINTQNKQCLFAYQFCYGSAVAAIKLSILSLYRRIFSVPKFKLAANIITGTVIAWWIAVVLVSIFSCNPINGFWDRVFTKSKCIKSESFFIGNAIPNIATDIIILALPLREV